MLDCKFIEVSSDRNIREFEGTVKTVTADNGNSSVIIADKESDIVIVTMDFDHYVSKDWPLSLRYGKVNSVKDPCNAKVYPVTFDNFGNVDIKFIFPEFSLYIITNLDTGITPSRPFIFKNFKAFDVNKNIADISCRVDGKGFLFETRSTIVEDEASEIDQNRLYFSIPISAVDKVKIYESSLYANGCLDFDKFFTEMEIWKRTLGFDLYNSNFTKTKFSFGTHSYMTSAEQDFSIFLVDDEFKQYSKIYANLLEFVDGNNHITKSCRADIVAMLNRWFVNRISNPSSFLTEFVKLDQAISKFIESAFDLKMTLTTADPKNSVLY